MGWLNFKIFKKDDGSLILASEINGKCSDINTWGVKRDVETRLAEHFAQVMIDKFSEEIMKEISTVNIVNDAREAFRSNMKDKLKGL